jgi:glycosyltransferase involved in cell wall biosynthesis
MISFVIPTLWKAPEITSILIDQFERCEHDYELIIIDNAGSGYENSNPKIRVLMAKENIGVNPAWNIGVKEARYDYVCLVNDDIAFNVTNFIHNINEFVKNQGEFHLIAPYDTHGSSGYFSTSINRDQDIWWKDRKTMTHKEFGMGCFMLFPKQVWIEIPEEIKIYYGDDILWYNVHSIMQSEKLFWFPKIRLIGDFHQSTGGQENSEVLQKENQYFQDLVNSKRILDLTQWQR